MKKITLLMLSLFISIAVFAQGKKDAKTLLAYERYSSAKTALANASSEEDKYLLGLAEIGLGNIDEAQKIFTSLGESEYGQAGLARVLFLKGDYKSANDLLDKMVDKAKRKEYYKYQLAADAITYTNGGDINKAIDWYKKAMEKKKTAEQLVAMGDAYLKLNTSVGNGEALTCYQDAVALDPNNSLAHSRQGYLLNAGRQYEAALKEYQAASSIDPENPLPYRDLANAYYFVNKFQLAKENIEKYLKLSDATEEDLYHYTNLLYLTKDYPGALTKIDEVFAKVKNPKPYLYRIKAFSLYETKKLTEAKIAMEKFFEINKGKKEFIYKDYFYLGKIYADLSTTDEAQKERYLVDADNAFEKGVEIMDPNLSFADEYELIAKSFEAAKDYGRAAKWYGKIVEKLGDKVTSYEYFNYGYWTYFSLDFAKAKKIFGEMEQKFPTDKDKFYSLYWKGLAGAQIDKEAKTGEGVQDFQNWLNLPQIEGKNRTPDQLKNSYQYLTYYYYNKSDKDNAVKYATLLQEVAPDSEFAKQILDYYKK